MNKVGRRKDGLGAALIVLVLVGGSIGACTPAVRIEAPDKPIEINLNIKIEQEIRIRLDKEVEDLIDEHPDIF